MANRRGEQGLGCDREGWALEPRDSVRSQTQAPGQGDGATGRPKLVRDVGRLLVPACGPLADTGWSWDSRGWGWGLGEHAEATGSPEATAGPLHMIVVLLSVNVDWNEHKIAKSS